MRDSTHNRIQNAAMIFAGILIIVVVLLSAMPIVQTTFNPVVSQIEVVQSEFIAEDRQEVFVKFDKYRECEFLGLRMKDPVGYRVDFVFKDVQGDTYQSRPEGFNVAGPWEIQTKWPIEDLRIEAIHSCTGVFNQEYKVLSVMNEGK